MKDWELSEGQTRSQKNLAWIAKKMAILAEIGENDGEMIRESFP
jgi:hypothetical protein